MIRASVAAAALILSLTALPAAAELKVGAVRSAEIADRAPQFKSMQAKMKAEFERRKNDLEADAKKLQDDARVFQKEADTLTATDRAAKEKSLTTRRIDLESKGRTLQEDAQKRQQELFMQSMGSIKTVIDALAKERGLDVIIENPVFVKPELDLTAEVLKRLQAAPAAPAAK